LLLSIRVYLCFAIRLNSLVVWYARTNSYLFLGILVVVIARGGEEEE
jgi:hypothetical protein